MGFDYARSAIIKSQVVAIAVALALALDSPGLLLLYFSQSGFSTSTAYKNGVADYSFKKSV
ncbi:hypothetical protein NGA_0209101, partial [Nannochloropsis gaditana CCMP526]